MCWPCRALRTRSHVYGQVFPTTEFISISPTRLRSECTNFHYSLPANNLSLVIWAVRAGREPVRAISEMNSKLSDKLVHTHANGFVTLGRVSTCCVFFKFCGGESKKWEEAIKREKRRRRGGEREIGREKDIAYVGVSFCWIKRNAFTFIVTYVISSIVPVSIPRSHLVSEPFSRRPASGYYGAQHGVCLANIRRKSVETVSSRLPYSWMLSRYWCIYNAAYCQINFLMCTTSSGIHSASVFGTTASLSRRNQLFHAHFSRIGYTHFAVQSYLSNCNIWTKKNIYIKIVETHSSDVQIMQWNW